MQMMLQLMLMLMLMGTPLGVQLFTVVLSSESSLHEARLMMMMMMGDIQRVSAALLGIVAGAATTTATFGATVLKAHQGYLHPAAIRTLMCEKQKRLVEPRCTHPLRYIFKGKSRTQIDVDR